jgi:hypothetical protein
VVKKVIKIEKPSSVYESNKAYRLIKAKIGSDLAKLAYDEVLSHQKKGSNIDLTMWYTLVNHRENPSWNFKAYHKNSDGTYDVGLGQVNSGKVLDRRLFNPRYNIKRSIGILAQKNIYAGGAKWLTFKRYNGDGPRATEYATICWTYYTRLKGA